MLRSSYAASGLLLVLIGTLVEPSAVFAQNLQPRARVEAMALDSLQVGHVTAYFRPADRRRAVEMASLADKAVNFFGREFSIAFDPDLAALAQDDWFSEFPGVPYAVPWASMPSQLMFMPSSLREGVLIQGPDSLADRRRVDFVLLHELGHIAAKVYFRPSDKLDYLPVSWFEELLATSFAVAYLKASDPEWAADWQAEMRSQLNAFTPSVISLDWSFMNELSGAELSRTYGWYQFLLNLKAAEIYADQGLNFLRAVKERLPWTRSSSWNTELLLPLLDDIAPGFADWEAQLQKEYGG